MTKLNRDQLVEMLVESEAKIAYTKKDGTARDVFATLKPSMIPEVTNPAPVKETHLTVFDTEKQQWRTLLVDQIGEIAVGVPQKTLVGALA
jgi:hypothetical protein|tara:strand:- start:2815 stop:3087 length:273 start_codon:yes stop_codon:yes gene_type:complete